MASLIYLDNSNLLNSANNHLGTKRNIDLDHEINYGRLLDFLRLGEPAKRAVVYASSNSVDRVHVKQSMKVASQLGWEVVHHGRNKSDQEKQIDTEIVSDMILDGLELVDPKNDQMILVSGDGDFIPAVKKLRKRGIPVAVAFWNFYASQELVSDGLFVDLTPHFKTLIQPSKHAYHWAHAKFRKEDWDEDFSVRALRR